MYSISPRIISSKFGENPFSRGNSFMTADTVPKGHNNEQRSDHKSELIGELTRVYHGH